MSSKDYDHEDQKTVPQQAMAGFGYYPPEGMNLFRDWDMLLLAPEAPESKTETGLHIEQAPVPVGVVILPAYAAGRRVLHMPYAGTMVKIDGEKRLILPVASALLWLGDEKVENS